MERKTKLVLGLAVTPLLLMLLIIFILVASDPGDNLRLIESGSRYDQSGVPFVTGSIRNFADNSYQHLRFELDFLNSGGGIVGGTITQMNDLGIGETWDFDVPVLSEGVAEVRLRDLTCSKSGEEPHPRACHIAPTLVSLRGG